MKPKKESDLNEKKSSRTILDFFGSSNSQKNSAASSSRNLVTTIHCPACSDLISETRLNYHLDNECSSAVKKETKTVKSKKKIKKKQSKKAKPSLESGEDEVIVIGPCKVSSPTFSDDEIYYSSNNKEVKQEKFSVSSQSNSLLLPKKEIFENDKVSNINHIEGSVASLAKDWDDDSNEATSCSVNIKKEEPEEVFPKTEKKHDSTAIEIEPNTSSYNSYTLDALLSPRKNIIKRDDHNSILKSELSLSPGIRRKINSYGLSPRKKGKLSSNDSKDFNATNLNYSPSKLKKSKSFPSKSPEEYRSVNGMYLDNFLTVVDFIKDSVTDYKYFNDEEKEYISSFYCLSLQAKKLFVRLFQRILKWKRVDSIVYQDICDQEDIVLYVKELSYAKFLILEEELVDLNQILNLLSNGKLEKLSKIMKVNVIKKNRDTLIEALLNTSKKQPTISNMFSKSKNSGSGSLVQQKAKKLLGACCIVNRDIRKIFMRMLTLFSLPRYDEDDENGNQWQLITMLRVNIGQVHYPKDVTRMRIKDIFRNREDLLQFESCRELCTTIRDCLEKHQWEESLSNAHLVNSLYEELVSNVQLLEHDKQLPDFLRRYSSLSILTYLKFLQVEALQRLKQYDKAVEVLRFILQQETYLPSSRGSWYDRLALNLDQHLKHPRESLEVIRRALSDSEVRVGYRLALSIRARKLLSTKCKKSVKSAGLCEHCLREDTMRGVDLMSPIEAPKVVIEGRSLSMPHPQGLRRVFLRQDSSRHSGEGQVTACSVEELSLGHYNHLGYSQGLHAEGLTINSIFGVLFWSAIYLAPVADAFRLLYQSTPLDLDSMNFYKARREIIQKRVEQISKMSSEEILSDISIIWSAHHNERCIVNWDLFTSVEHLHGLVMSLGLSLVTKICLRLAMDHRFTRSGFPDLIVWDPVRRVSKVVEVKGPNDRLSTKQILWLEYLLENGADTEVCHVEAIGAKKMTKTMKKDSDLSPGKENECEEKEQETKSGQNKGSVKKKRTAKRKLVLKTTEDISDDDDDFIAEKPAKKAR